MAAIKTTTVTFRILSEIEAAEREHRSLANRLEVMIRDWRGRAGVGPVVHPSAMTERRA